MNAPLESAPGMYPVSFATAFAVGVALDGVDPVFTAGITPAIDKSTVADATEFGIIEAEDITLLGSLAGAVFPDHPVSRKPAGRPGGATFGRDPGLGKYPLDEADTVCESLIKATAGEVLFGTGSVVVFADLDGADFGGVDPGHFGTKRCLTFRRGRGKRSCCLRADGSGLGSDLGYCRLAMSSTPEIKSEE